MLIAPWHKSLCFVKRTNSILHHASELPTHGTSATSKCVGRKKNNLWKQKECENTPPVVRTGLHTVLLFISFAMEDNLKKVSQKQKDPFSPSGLLRQTINNLSSVPVWVHQECLTVQFKILLKIFYVTILVCQGKRTTMAWGCVFCFSLFLCLVLNTVLSDSEIPICAG